MDVNGDAQRLGGFENGPKLRVIQVFALRVRIDDGALEPERLHAALQLAGRFRRILGRNGSESGESPGMAANGLGQLVV